MSKYPQSLERLLEQLQQLPTVGPKTASRLAFYLLDASKERVLALAKAMVEVKERLRACTRCGNIAEDDLCEIPGNFYLVIPQNILEVQSSSFSRNGGISR